VTTEVRLLSINAVVVVVVAALFVTRQFLIIINFTQFAVVNFHYNKFAGADLNNLLLFMRLLLHNKLFLSLFFS